MDGKQLSASDFFKVMRSIEKAGDEEWLREQDLKRQGLVLVSGIWMSAETAAEIKAELEAA